MVGLQDNRQGNRSRRMHRELRRRHDRCWLRSVHHERISGPARKDVRQVRIQQAYQRKPHLLLDRIPVWQRMVVQVPRRTAGDTRRHCPPRTHAETRRLLQGESLRPLHGHYSLISSHTLALHARVFFFLKKNTPHF